MAVEFLLPRPRRPAPNRRPMQENASELPRRIKLSEVLSALSCALDITGGQPEGHAVRSCLTGMRIAREAGLPAAEAAS